MSDTITEGRATAIVDQKRMSQDLLPTGGEFQANNAFLRELTRRRPGRVLLDVGFCYGVIFFAFALLAWFDSWLMALLSFVLIGNRQYALAVLAHDGKHGNLLPGREANDRFLKFALCAPFGIRGEIAKHLTHHQLFGGDLDPDLPLYSVADKNSIRRFVFCFLGAIASVPLAIVRYARDGKQSSYSGTKTSRNHVEKTRRDGLAVDRLSTFLSDRWPAIVAQLAIIAVAISAFFPPWYYLLFWIAPMPVLLLIPQKIRMFAEHAAVPGRNGDLPRLVTFTPNPIERALISPMNINYHSEHHLWPYVPYFNLPKLHEHVHRHDEIDIDPSYFGFLRKYVEKLPYEGLAERRIA